MWKKEKIVMMVITMPVAIGMVVIVAVQSILHLVDIAIVLSVCAWTIHSKIHAANLMVM